MRDHVLCDRNHRVVSSEDVPCRCGDSHQLWTCKMRVGSKPCGWRWLFPALARECAEDDD